MIKRERKSITPSESHGKVVSSVDEQFVDRTVISVVVHGVAVTDRLYNTTALSTKTILNFISIDWLKSSLINSIGY